MTTLLTAHGLFGFLGSSPFLSLSLRKALTPPRFSQIEKLNTLLMTTGSCDTYLVSGDNCAFVL